MLVWNENRRDVTRGQAMEAGGPELVAWDGEVEETCSSLVHCDFPHTEPRGARF